MTQDLAGSARTAAAIAGKPAREIAAFRLKIAAT
jgi:hypothetical protein